VDNRESGRLLKEEIEGVNAFLETRVNDYKLTSCGNGLDKVAARIEEPLRPEYLEK
jgi:hypothetical protein